MPIMKFEPIPPMSGADALLSLLDFLKDKPGVEKRFKELEALRQEINEKIATVGKVEDVEALHAAAVADRQKATEALRAAKEHATETTKHAFAARDAAIAEAAQIREQNAEARKAIEADKLAWERQRGDREGALRVMEDDIRQARDRALAHEAVSERMREEWDEKMGRLKAAGIA